MKLDKYKTADGRYLYEGCSYEDILDLLQVGILGFCACGNPDDNLVYVLGALELISEDRPNFGASMDEWSKWSAAHKARELSHFGSEEAASFFYYWADKEGLTEHGGSIPGWLDESGVELLANLREWRETIGEKG